MDALRASVVSWPLDFASWDSVRGAETPRTILIAKHSNIARIRHVISLVHSTEKIGASAFPICRVGYGPSTQVGSWSSGDDEVWEALRALYLIGQPEDLPAIQLYERDSPQISDRVRKQAALTDRAIREKAATSDNGWRSGTRSTELNLDPTPSPFCCKCRI